MPESARGRPDGRARRLDASSSRHGPSGCPARASSLAGRTKAIASRARRNAPLPAARSDTWCFIDGNMVLDKLFPPDTRQAREPGCFIQGGIPTSQRGAELLLRHKVRTAIGPFTNGRASPAQGLGAITGWHNNSAAAS